MDPDGGNGSRRIQKKMLTLEPGEARLLQRDGISCKLSGDVSRVKDKGTLYLTSSRIIFVPARGGQHNKRFWDENQGMISIPFLGQSHLPHDRVVDNFHSHCRYKHIFCVD
jgi:hypothetical protein